MSEPIENWQCRWQSRRGVLHSTDDDEILGFEVLRTLAIRKRVLVWRAECIGYNKKEARAKRNAQEYRPRMLQPHLRINATGVDEPCSLKRLLFRFRCLDDRRCLRSKC